MAHQVPAHGRGQWLSFMPQFLRPALAKIEDAEFRQDGGRGRTDRFGDGHKSDGGAWPAGTRTGGADAVLQPSEALLLEDARRTEQTPPRFVIAQNSADFGVVYGVCANCGCMFPKISWRSTRFMCDLKKKLPLIEYIRQNYHPVAVIADKKLLAHN